ncbi:unnamed protein product [Linum trigynum]|uniref:Uncharacterized protein n=1 Tax=Linum trigynum TaxID=586398 RepID=A0AAV2G1G5_9ROSI
MQGGFPASASRAPVVTTTTSTSPQSTAGGNIIIGDADRMASAVNNASIGGTESVVMTPQAYNNSTGLVQDWCNMFCNKKACKNYKSYLCDDQPPSCYPTCYCPTNSCFCFCPR